MNVTRFAPSPTGRLHLGHAASARFAFEKARADSGRFLLRIEDIDPVRCRAEYIEGIYEDLAWFGLSWEQPVRRQSEHLKDYAAGLDKLRSMDLLYPCFCTRKEVEAEAEASVHAPHIMPEGAEGPLYPGTCRGLSSSQREELAQARPCVWRLDMKKAAGLVGPLHWHDVDAGSVTANPERFGDVVLARKDVATSYHLSVTVDDAIQGITCVTRGRDLFAVTDIHVLLQKLLDLPTPEYHHHPLLVDAQGRRFAKRDQSLTICAMRKAGLTPEEVWKQAVFG